MSGKGAYRFRALRRDGSIQQGVLDADSERAALAQLRAQGAQPVDVRRIEAARERRREPAASHRKAALRLIEELAVLLEAGLPLDRSLALAMANVEDEDAGEALRSLLKAVREGVPLSRAMADLPQLFTPAEAAMAEAGEANGRLGTALGELARMLRNAAELRRLVATSMIYPAALLVISVSVVLLMLLYVVPQFERLLDASQAQLPAASMAVIGASRFVRDDGLFLLGGLAVALIGLKWALSQPHMRRRLDFWLLRVPVLGELLRRTDTARFAHVLGTLVEAGVPVPAALAIAQRALGNSAIAEAVRKVGEGVREGGGLTAPMAAAGVLPRLAIGFLRTGEETSRLGLMLGRLADVMDRDVRYRLERLVAILTPAITVVLGTVVAGIIASIMSAILGFNDLAVAQP